ncbi:hypothetical protein C8R44DRAFT_748559 [Mycena epipterygia]|nr:hypothetical protein C8R44DRAFT_748559 [Mycena epipterygia]
MSCLFENTYGQAVFLKANSIKTYRRKRGQRIPAIHLLRRQFFDQIPNLNLEAQAKFGAHFVAHPATAALIQATPGARVVTMAGWMALLTDYRNARPENINIFIRLTICLNLSNLTDLEPFVDGAGGSFSDLAAVLVTHLTLIYGLMFLPGMNKSDDRLIRALCEHEVAGPLVAIVANLDITSGEPDHARLSSTDVLKHTPNYEYMLQAQDGSIVRALALTSRSEYQILHLQQPLEYLFYVALLRCMVYYPAVL